MYQNLQPLSDFRQTLKPALDVHLKWLIYNEFG